MYVLEIFGTLLFLSFIVSCVLFVTLTVHSLVESHRRKVARQVEPGKSKVTHARPATLAPDAATRKSLAADMAKD